MCSMSFNQMEEYLRIYVQCAISKNKQNMQKKRKNIARNIGVLSYMMSQVRSQDNMHTF